MRPRALTRVRTSNGRSSAPSTTRLRSRIAASGQAKKTARNATGTATVATPPTLSARRSRSIGRPSGRGSRRCRRPGAEAASAGTIACSTKASGSATPAPHGVDEHRARHVGLEPLGEHEVDQRAGAVLVRGAAQDARVLDLAVAPVLDRGRRRDVERLRGEDHLRGGARRVGDDDRPLAGAPGGAGELLRVRLLPAVDSEHAVRPERPPVRLPAVLAEPVDGREQEGEPGGGGRRVLDHQEVAVPGLGRGPRASAGGRSRGPRTTRGRRSGRPRRGRSASRGRPAPRTPGRRSSSRPRRTPRAGRPRARARGRSRRSRRSRRPGGRRRSGALG